MGPLIPCRIEIEEPAGCIHLMGTCYIHLDYNWFCYIPGARSAARRAGVRGTRGTRARCAGAVECTGACGSWAPGDRVVRTRVRAGSCPRNGRWRAGRWCRSFFNKSEAFAVCPSNQQNCEQIKPPDKLAPLLCTLFLVSFPALNSYIFRS